MISKHICGFVEEADALSGIGTRIATSSQEKIIPSICEFVKIMAASFHVPVFSCIEINALSAWADAIAGPNCKTQKWGGYSKKIFLAFKSRQVRKSNAPVSIELCSYAFSKDLWEAVQKEPVPPLTKILGEGKPVNAKSPYYIWEYLGETVPVEEKIDEIVKAILAVVR